MSDLVKLNFEGSTLTTLRYHGRPCWIAREVGTLLGYAQGGKRLATKVNGDWSEEFVEGKDHCVIRGKELEQFRSLVEVGAESVPSYAGSLTLLFESGMHLILTKTNKPVGRRLRRFLVDEVLPQIARDGSYTPERQVVDGELTERVERTERATSHLALVADLEERRFKSEWLVRLVDRLESRQRVAPDVADAYWVVAAEIATGIPLSNLKPQVEDDWLSPTVISQRTGAHLHQVGRAISQLGLRGNHAGLCKAIVNKAKGHDRTVTSYLYSPRAVAQIEAALRPDSIQARRLAAGVSALEAG